MKRFFIFFTTSIFIIVSDSCELLDECKYDNENYTDLNLFVSFIVNGELRKFYQINPAVMFNADAAERIYVDDKDTIFRNKYFVRFSEKTDRGYLLNRSNNGDFRLIFHKGHTYGAINDYSLYVDPTEIFQPSLFFSYSESYFDNKDPKDTIFMSGISLDWTKEDDSKYMSTDNAFIRLKQNKDSIISYFKDCNVTINKLQKECGNFYIIEGQFEAKIEKEYKVGQVPTILRLTDGKFRFLRKFDED